MSLSLHIAFLINVTSARVLTEGVIIAQWEGILESSIPEGPFVNNVYRRSLALAPPRPPPPVFPVYNLTRSPTYRRALLSERLEQANLLATDKSRYFAQPRPIIVKYLVIKTILDSLKLSWSWWGPGQSYLNCGICVIGKIWFQVKFF